MSASKSVPADVVLGIHALSHDAGVALIAGDEVVSVSEERLSRRKYDDAFPERAARAVLDEAGIGIDEVDLVVTDHLDGKAAPTLAAVRETLGFHRRGPHAIRHHDAHAASAFLLFPLRRRGRARRGWGRAASGEGCGTGRTRSLRTAVAAEDV